MVSSSDEATLSAQDILAHLDAGGLWPHAPAGERLGLPQAYAHAARVVALREARGERPRGYKIGFTNRNMWARYGVLAPIWGRVWDTTLSDDPDAQGAALSLAALSQPRIEPEVVFGLRATPASDAPQALFEALDWVAPGFEIVQSHLPGWRFTAADGVIDGGLHARLRIGPRLPVRDLASDAEALHALLAALHVSLTRDGELVDQGVGANVLDSPLRALGHFVRELSADTSSSALTAGDVVTTGTLTDAWPVEPGQTWQADFGGVLPMLAVRFN